MITRPNIVCSAAVASALLWLAPSAPAVAAEIDASGDTAIVIAQQRSTSSGPTIAPQTTYSPALISKARRSEDELEDCMNNPDNASIPYIDRLGACFCLSIDNALEGCQKAD